MNDEPTNCSRCGAPLPSTGQFCEQCGAPIEGRAAGESVHYGDDQATLISPRLRQDPEEPEQPVDEEPVSHDPVSLGYTPAASAESYAGPSEPETPLPPIPPVPPAPPQAYGPRAPDAPLPPLTSQPRRSSAPYIIIAVVSVLLLVVCGCVCAVSVYFISGAQF